MSRERRDDDRREDRRDERGRGEDRGRREERQSVLVRNLPHDAR